MLEAGTIKQEEMKEKIRKEYLKRTRKLFCGGNLTKGINNRVIFQVRYRGPFLKWRKEELQ